MSLRTLRLLALPFLLSQSVFAAEAFRVATFNLENYIDVPVEGRPSKSPEARAAVRESIRLLAPDVLALQEIGNLDALLELRASLKAGGLDFPFYEHVIGHDQVLNVAVFSKFAFSARRAHTNESYLLNGNRLRTSRGFAEVDIQVNPTYSFTLITAHLKSKRIVAVDDESDMRLEEAKLLRRLIETRLQANPNLNLIVLGDFNDTKDSPAIKTIVGKGKAKLVDTRPIESIGGANGQGRAADSRSVSWTHYFATQDSYTRVDYILVSPGLAREWDRGQTYVLTVPSWGIASDHRPLVAGFMSQDQ